MAYAAQGVGFQAPHVAVVRVVFEDAADDGETLLADPQGLLVTVRVEENLPGPAIRDGERAPRDDVLRVDIDQPFIDRSRAPHDREPAIRLATLCEIPA